MRRLGAVPPRRATVTSSRLSVTCGTGIITGLAVYAPAWTDETQPRTDRPVRFRRVAIRKRDAWGTGWDHYSKSETFRYGY